MKKYYYKNSFNDTVYSNDPNIPDATPVKLIYNCAKVVNNNGISSYDSYAGGTAPWFCIKDGNVEFYAEFSSNSATNTITSINKKYYRRIFTYTQDSLTNSWWITGDSSWAARRKIPLLEKKELFEGTNPVICVQNRFDDDGNIIGNKLSWKISPDNMKYYPTIGGPYPSFRYYIKYINPRSPSHTEQYYNGNPAGPYSSMWTTNYNQKTIFNSYYEAENLFNQMGDRIKNSLIVNPSQDDTTSACNFKSEYYASYTMSGFLGWGVENAGYMPFTPSNWCSIVYPPTAIENTEFDFTAKMNSIGASPSYFTLDISKVPTKYTKLDVVIDGVFYYPYNNDIGPQVSPITDKNNIFNVYNFGEPLDYPTYNCWAYLYKPDNEEDWNFENKYALSAKNFLGNQIKMYSILLH